MGAAANASDQISRTTPEGRTELDANELLRSDQVRRTYEAFKKWNDLTRQSTVQDEFTKLRNLTAHLAANAESEALMEQLIRVENLMTRAARAMPERDQLQEVIDALRGPDKRR